MNLNKDQKFALNFIDSWWNGQERYMILGGRGGTGKSFLINKVIKTLKGCIPILLCPTNESLKQLKDKITGDYEFRTIHSALGISPTTHDQELKFEHISIPDLWDKYNLCILDEASMVSDELLEILLSIGIRIIFCGHESQLPPVKINRSIFDKCISPVFEKGYPVVTLKEPMRNKGKLWEFNNHLEEMIYSAERIIPNTFDIKQKDLIEVLSSEAGKENLLNGTIKVVAWSNDKVDSYNQYIRTFLYGKERATNKYVKDDLIILTAPLTALDCLDMLSERNLEKEFMSKRLEYSLYSNTKATVKGGTKTIINLNPTLSIPCYKIYVDIDGEDKVFFEPIDKKDFEKISTYYTHIAWGIKKHDDRQKAFKKMHFILSCFAQVKHFFAGTTYRLQGSGYSKIIVLHSDLAKVPNMIERKKHIYVGCSRSVDELYIYRGI